MDIEFIREEFEDDIDYVTEKLRCTDGLYTFELTIAKEISSGELLYPMITVEHESGSEDYWDNEDFIYELYDVLVNGNDYDKYEDEIVDTVINYRTSIEGLKAVLTEGVERRYITKTNQ